MLQPEYELNAVDSGLWRDLWAYWILGLCNNNGFIVMLSAAHDVMRLLEPNDDHRAISPEEIDRGCKIYSTGVILLADIVPALCFKLVAPFLPFWINSRIVLAVSLSLSGLIIVGFATVDWLAILGVALTSASCGILETTLLSYSSHFDPDVISTWSSGNGAAGIIGSFSYAFMRSIGLSLRTSMLLMLIYPIFEIPVFWFLLRTPHEEKRESKKIRFTDEEPLLTIGRKCKFISELTVYLVPLWTVYFSEYFINMGLYEFVFFEKVTKYVERDSQFRWFMVDFQLAIFISRSTVGVLTINRIWILALFQVINVVYFYTQAIWFYTPSIVITLCFIFWEGCLGGAAYVNTFYRMSKEVTANRREFSMSVVMVAAYFGIMLAGIVCLPVHKVICSIPGPKRDIVIREE